MAERKGEDMSVNLGKGNRERRSTCAETERRKAEGMAAGREKAREKRVKRIRTSQAYLQEIVGEVDLGDIREVTRRLMEQAKEGDRHARDWLGKYVLGGGKIDLRELGAPSILKRK